MYDKTNAFPRWAAQALKKLSEEAKDTILKQSCSPEALGLCPALTVIEIMLNKLEKFANNPDVISDPSFKDISDLLPQEFFHEAVEESPAPPAKVEVRVPGKVADADIPDIIPVEGRAVDYLTLTDVQREQIYRLVDMQLGQEKIGKLMNVSRHVVRTVIKRRTTPPTRQHRLSPEQDKVIAHMFTEKKLSMTKIGDLLNITHVAVGNSLELLPPKSLLQKKGWREICRTPLLLR